jgi:hypothetical protein
MAASPVCPVWHFTAGELAIGDGGGVLLETAPQTEHLPPQARQPTSVNHPQSAGLDVPQYVKPAELLAAHLFDRHEAPPATPEHAGVSPLSCRGVSSPYGGYVHVPQNPLYGKCPRDLRCLTDGKRHERWIVTHSLHDDKISQFSLQNICSGESDTHIVPRVWA